LITRIQYSIMNELSLIEHRGSYQILLFLMKRETAYFTELKESLEAGQHSIYSAIKDLLYVGLVEEERVHPFNKRVFQLTEKGKKVAELLAEIEKILQD